MVAKIGFEVVSVRLQLALRDSEVQLRERLDTARLEFAEIIPQRIGGDAREPTNVLVGQLLALQPQNLHALTHSRVRMLITQPLDLAYILSGELDSDHRRRAAVAWCRVATSIP
jgi:hypothetical protein